ncbi:hypothetical protein LEP1GSC104_1279 [Leptospira interrogans str. UI 12621]|uniref:Uncharacterized protein n=1 Tax=Leptospira interrogans str. UI 12621 TaxID=1049937 RepID=A0A0F6HEW7_LEPIR|nr:hypothetical protein LEP1GSC104_1279 [Leptospira interrogans str. UI 12621]
MDKFISSPYCKNKKLPKNMSSKIKQVLEFFHYHFKSKVLFGLYENWNLVLDFIKFLL